MFKIDSNVPPPSKIEGQTSNIKYPFNEMKIGDSIFFENCNHQSNPIAAAKIHFRRKKQKMTAKKENNGIRIWRLT